MLSLFIKPNEANRIKVMLLLFADHKVTLSQIQEQTETPATTTHRLIKDLTNDLEDCFDGHVHLTNSLQLFTLTNTSELSRTQVIHQLTDYYLARSLTFQIFTEVFSKKKLNSLQLCLDINISQSYCYKLINEINGFLAKYQLTIMIQKNILSLVGPETTILFVSYLAKNNLASITTCSTLATDFSSLLTHFYQFDELSEFNHYQKKALVAMYEATMFRYETLNNIRLLNKDAQAILATLTQVHDPFISTSYLSHETEETRLFFNLMLRSIVPVVDSKQKRILIAKKLLTLADNQMIQSVQCLIKVFNEQFFASILACDSDFYYDFIYILALQACYIEIFGRNIKEELDMIITYFHSDATKKKLALERTDRATEILDANNFPNPNWNTRQKLLFTSMLNKTFYSVVHTVVQPVYYLFVYFPNALDSENVIKSQLLAFFSEKHVQFVKDITQADLVITDTFLVLEKELPIFLFIDIESDELFETLLAAIAKGSYRKQKKSGW